MILMYITVISKKKTIEMNKFKYDRDGVIVLQISWIVTFIILIFVVSVQLIQILICTSQVDVWFAFKIENVLIIVLELYLYNVFAFPFIANVYLHVVWVPCPFYHHNECVSDLKYSNISDLKSITISDLTLLLRDTHWQDFYKSVTS